MQRRRHLGAESRTSCRAKLGGDHLLAVTERTRKILWARSGNRCALCRRTLVEDATQHDDRAVVGEECHIYPKGGNGPRASGPIPDDVDHYSNLILLCGGCHTVVDSQEETYTIDKLRGIRDQHEAWVARTLHTASVPPAGDESEISENEWPDREALFAGVESDQLFADRLADAFPGTHGLTVVSDPVAALERIGVVLRQPLHQWHWDPDNSRRKIYPFWWFRGGLCLHISNFRQLGRTHCLLDAKELKVRRVAAFRRSYTSMWDFLYIETDPDPPVGIYDYGSERPEKLAAGSYGGFYCEEYAIWKGSAISRADYDDGATLVDGRPRPVLAAELRTRFLTPYNFIVCGNRHVINEAEHDRVMEVLLTRIIRGEGALDELARLVDGLPKPARFYTQWD